MIKEVLNALAPVFVDAIITMLVVIVPLVAKIIIQYVKAKLVQVQNTVGEQNYNAIKSVAEDIYFLVEQKYIVGLIDDKKKEFDKLLLEKIPSLTQEEIDSTREAICGKINSYLK